MTCQKLVAFLMRYLDGQLTEEERLRFEEHLMECPDCVAYLATYRETILFGKAVCAWEEAIASQAPEELVQAILSTRARHGP